MSSKFKRLLCRWRWPDINALQREHASLGRGTAWRGKTANLSACRQDSVARDDQGHRIICHGLANIAGGFRSGTEFLRQGAVGCRAAPPDPPGRRVNALEERILLAEVEPDAGKIRLLALEIALCGGDCFGHLRRGSARFCAGQRRSRIRSVALALLVGNWKRVMPALFHEIPQKPPAVSKMR
jgi:hypothetical protein